MKLTGGSGEILRVALPFVSPRIYSSGVVFELILGLWLISGLARAWSWLIALLFFGLLGYMSFQLGWYGQASCGCAGAIPISPWLAFGIDVVACFLLLMFRPICLASSLRNGLPTLAYSLMVLALLGVPFVLYHGSLNGALARLRGETIVIDPNVVDIGSGLAGEFRECAVHVRNVSAKPIRIIGVSNSCSCVVTSSLPVVVPAYESGFVSLRMTFDGSIGPFRRKMVLFVDDDQRRIMPVVVMGNVKG